MPIAQPSPSIRQIIEAAAARFGVPLPIALAVAYVESRFNPEARNSRSGATGLFQLMPATAEALGVTDMTDSAQSANAGLRFLANLRKRWGSWSAALAAYNWGPGNLGRALEEGRSWPGSVQANYIDPVIVRAQSYAHELGIPWHEVPPAPPTPPEAPSGPDTPSDVTPPVGPATALATAAAVLGLLWLLNRARGASV